MTAPHHIPSPPLSPNCRLSSAMPNPSRANLSPPIIARSLSDPNLSLKNHPHLPPPSNRSTRSSTTTSTRRRRPQRRSTKNSELTEESLEEFNRRNEAKELKKATYTSPYYYGGLTDSTLYFSRQKLSKLSPGSGKESHATASTSSSISTAFVKLQEWGSSCFKGKVKSESKHHPSDDTAKSSLVIKNDSFSSINTIAIKEAVELRKKSLISDKVVVSSNSDEKPLRERVLTAPLVHQQQQQVVVVVEEVLGEERPPMVRIEEKLMQASKEKEKQFVWANQYRPKALKDFICNRDKAEQLIELVQKGECNHYIFEGPHGVGKRTMVWALLREAFGADKLTTTVVCKEFVLKGEASHSIKVNVKVSSKHVEINASELGGYEKHVFVELIKEKYNLPLAQAMQCDHTNCHAIILHEADKLSTDAQLYIRWLMERNRGCNKIFFCCHDASKLQTIRSLCKFVQLLPPSNKEIVEVLEFIAEQENIQLPHQLAERIAGNSQHNLRQAIRSFEASWQLNSSLNEEQVIMTGWEEDIANIAKNIIEEQSPKQLYVIRGKLQCLIEHNVSPDFIFSTLVDELKKLLGENFHSRIDTLYQEYSRDNGRMFGTDKSLIMLHKRNGETEGKRKNVHQFLRIEEFTAKFMSRYKSYMSHSINEPSEHVN